MPVIDFWVRTPGEHKVLRRVSLDSHPRAGELVMLDDKIRIVHEVTHDVALNVLQVILKD